jgi:chemotaxis signal transduction protein
MESLVREKMSNVQAELAAKAQYVIDIVVRNLYERTADVGFLATDRELCAFVAGIEGDTEAMRRRLRAYRSKYTVYDEIILLDLAGKVLVQIDEATPCAQSRDPLVASTIAADGYVETFRASDLRPSKREALIYSRRVCHPDTGAVVGVLCLCFAFEEEMARIFATHRDRSERSNMLLLDAGNRIIASADPVWMPLGAQVPVNREGMPGLAIFAGREYLVRTFASGGYQGYAGPPGWQGQVMIPLDIAFGSADSATLAGLDPEWADGLLSHAHSFCPPLFAIMGATEMIRRVVWNGQVMTAGNGGDLARMESILEQISETGARSNELFSQSIRDLFGTVLASGLREAEFVSHLLVDLLDRNLYERANDCRWWALSPELRALLAGGHPDRGQRMARILDHINGLYTVYTAIFVYERNGDIIASTGDHGVAGIDDVTLERVLALRTEQDYHVSPFAPTPLYGDRPTYVYHAAIRDPGDDSQVIGGIGIVFDATTEFDAMLRGVLGDKKNVQAWFIDRSGAIIASTDPARQIGTMFDIEPAMLALDNGAGAASVLTHDDHYAVMGCTASNGYREFKVTDGHRADVIAVVVESFGKVRTAAARGSRTVPLIESSRTGQASAEFATFFIDGDMFAIAAEDVCEALPASRVQPISMGTVAGRVGVLALDGGPTGLDYVWVFDLGLLLSGKTMAIDTGTQVVVVSHGGRAIGLMVSELHGVAKFDRSHIIPTPLAPSGNGMLVKQVIKANEASLLVQVVDTAYLFGMLKNPEAA